MGLFGRQAGVAADGGWLVRLAADTRANTLAIMAIALIPLSALAGSAVDTARMYVVKVRLQQACDAGALAGRKFMTDSNNPTLDANATTQAKAFFKNNFNYDAITKIGWMKTTITSDFTPTKTADNRVAGTVTATVPMTIMKMFNAPDVPITVTCEARFDVADTDIVFVLDTTGSMACLPSDSDSDCTNYVNQQVNNNAIVKYTRPSNSSKDVMAGYAGSAGYSVPEKDNSRIDALRAAVTDFYATMAGNIQPTTHVRYGFVTYTSTVNAGAAIRAMSPGYMIGGPGAGATWTYQSRQVTADYNIGSPTVTYPGTAQSACTGQTRTPATALTYNASTSQAVVTTLSWDSTNARCVRSAQNVGPTWTYGQYSQNVANYVAGNTVADPTEVNGATTKWLGCVEERNTTAGATTFDSANLPSDLDPDKIPSDDGSRWRPLWPDVEYRQLAYNTGNGGTYILSGGLTTNGDTYTTYAQYKLWGDNLNSTTNLVTGKAGNQLSGSVSCGKPIYRLSTMSPSDVSNYVNAVDFAPLGGTYHDTGMIWGVRLLSRNGIFKTDNTAWPGRSNPNQVIVFLTDGDMSPSSILYGQYGMENWDQRVTGGAGSPDLKTFHNNRFLAECAKANAMHIDVWTVSIAPSATPEMTTCASAADHALFTTDGQDLRDKFKAIAKQVARLRLSK